MVPGISGHFHTTLSLNSSTFRHLAKKWNIDYIIPHTKRRLLPGYSITEISTIEHLILLDLLGAPNPLIRSSFIETEWLFQGMVDAETRLTQEGAFNSTNDAALTERSFFYTGPKFAFGFGGIEDDHVPFVRMGVDVLHVITNPFPGVWHKLSVSVGRFTRKDLRLTTWTG